MYNSEFNEKQGSFESIRTRADSPNYTRIEAELIANFTSFLTVSICRPCPTLSYHGLTKAPTNLIMKELLLSSHYTVKKFSSLLAHEGGHTNNSARSADKNKNNLIIKLNNRTYVLGRDFLEWFVGFVYADGNFNISLRNFKDNKYNSVLLTFQIGLHIDDLELLKFIKGKLNCGHISISG